jgi:single-stranded DNA-binding protein
LIGRIGQTPEFYEFPQEKQTERTKGIYQFSLVTNKPQFNKETENWDQIGTWHKIQTFKNLNGIDKGFGVN